LQQRLSCESRNRRTVSCGNAEHHDTTRIDSVVTAILAKVPLPNVPGLGLTAINNFDGNTKFAKDSTSLDVRIDHNASPSNRLSGRFSFQNQSLQQTPIYGQVGGPSNGAFSGTGSSVSGIPRPTTTTSFQRG